VQIKDNMIKALKIRQVEPADDQSEQ
jgi:hypothetical protein